MNIYLVGSVFASAFFIALLVLYIRHAAWYWHVLSVAVALALGLTPFPDAYRPPDLLTGALFVFLMVWGLGEIVVHPYHRDHRAKAHAAGIHL